MDAMPIYQQTPSHRSWRLDPSLPCVRIVDRGSRSNEQPEGTGLNPRRGSSFATVAA